MAKLTLQELESTLWQCADILRGELSVTEPVRSWTSLIRYIVSMQSV